MTPWTPRPGDAVSVVMSKWGDRPHWEYAATYLGQDDHGAWLAVPTGTVFERPGRRFASLNDQATLLPVEGWWVATFHGPGEIGWPDLEDAPVDVYVDITTPVELDGRTVRCVDLDLDVVRGINGLVIVDDEDEFADHQVEFGYPSEVITQARAACDDVRRAAEARTGPFDGVAARVWLAQVAAL